MAEDERFHMQKLRRQGVEETRRQGVNSVRQMPEAVNWWGKGQ
jgi:hypothetical protein